jgi:hypothetical protein
LVDEAEKFAFGAGASVVTVRVASGDEGSALARPPSIKGIALVSERRCARIASALTAAGVEHRSGRSPSGVASVSFRDPNGVRWEFCVVFFSSMLASLPADDPRKTH